eukprot:6430320-Amphidinium_carterae.1
MVQHNNKQQTTAIPNKQQTAKIILTKHFLLGSLGDPSVHLEEEQAARAPFLHVLNGHGNASLHSETSDCRSIAKVIQTRQDSV